MCTVHSPLPPKWNIAMPCVLVKHVNPTDEAHLEAAKSDWECALFKSKRAATLAYDVGHVILLSNLDAYLIIPGSSHNTM